MRRAINLDHVPGFSFLCRKVSYRHGLLSGQKEGVMPTTETQRKIAELTMVASRLEERQASIRHKLVVVSCAIEAFADGTAVAKVPLTPKQSKWVQESLEAAKSLLPAKLRIASIVAEKIAKQVTVLRVDLLPLLERLKADLEADAASVAKEVAATRGAIANLSK